MARIRSKEVLDGLPSADWTEEEWTEYGEVETLGARLDRLAGPPPTAEEQAQIDAAKHAAQQTQGKQKMDAKTMAEFEEFLAWKKAKEEEGEEEQPTEKPSRRYVPTSRESKSGLAYVDITDSEAGRRYADIVEIGADYVTANMQNAICDLLEETTPAYDSTYRLKKLSTARIDGKRRYLVEVRSPDLEIARQIFDIVDPQEDDAEGEDDNPPKATRKKATTRKANPKEKAQAYLKAKADAKKKAPAKKAPAKKAPAKKLSQKEEDAKRFLELRRDEDWDWDSDAEIVRYLAQEEGRTNAKGRPWDEVHGADWQLKTVCLKKGWAEKEELFNSRS